MPLSVGTRLGPYEVLAKLGEGGMGEVYRARDTRLDRDVAIKVLPEAVAQDPDRLARFEREAKAIAALSHPNILAIHDFGRDPSTTLSYAAMELLEGSTLRDRLESGPLPPKKVVQIGADIAHGLAAAHSHALVHRDLKPENIFVTHDGRVKILDFGLARTAPLSGAGANLPTAASTDPGMVLGTVGYMSPEQVRGQPADHRSDLFSLGCVLFEMATGQRAFKRDSAADTLTAILRDDPPDFARDRSPSPSAIEPVIRRCLEKQPDERFQSASDLAFALQSLSMTATSSGATVVHDGGEIRRRRIPIVAIAAGVVLAAAGFFAARFFESAPTVTELSFQQLTDEAGLETEPSISPDGVSVAYTRTSGDTSDIYVQRVGGRNAVLVAGDPARAEGGAAFSPDGASIAFHDRNGRGGIFVGGATGESIRRLTDFGFHPSWSPDGQQLVFCTEAIFAALSRGSTSTLWIVDLKGGAPRQIQKGDAVQPVWSPSGRRIAYWGIVGGQRDIKTVSPDGGNQTLVTNDAAVDWGPVWSADGRWLYFASDRGGSMNLWRAPIDDTTGVVRGAPEAVTAGVAAADQPSISQNGSRLAFRSSETTTNPIAVPFDPSSDRAGSLRPLLDRTGVIAPSDVSASGEWLVLTNTSERREDLFVMRSDGTGLRRVTDDAFRDRRPRWSCDGDELIFDSDRNGRYQIWAIKPDGSGLRLIMSLSDSEPGNLALGTCSPEGRKLVASVSGEPRVFLLDPKRAASEQSPEPLAATMSDGSWIVPVAWSPDGRRLAGAVRTSTGANLGLAVHDIAARMTRLVARLPAGSNGVAWLARDSRRVVVSSGGDLLLIDVDTGQSKILLEDAGLGPGVAVSPDGRTIYASITRQQADVWVVDLKAR